MTFIFTAAKLLHGYVFVIHVYTGVNETPNQTCCTTWPIDTRYERNVHFFLFLPSLPWYDINQIWLRCALFLKLAWMYRF